MSTLLISYDLTYPENSEEYNRVINYIKSFGYWAKPHKSLWLIKTDKTTAQVRDEMRKYTDSNDKILVINITGAGWASYNLSDEVAEWFKNNL